MILWHTLQGLKPLTMVSSNFNHLLSFSKIVKNKRAGFSRQPVCAQFKDQKVVGQAVEGLGQIQMDGCYMFVIIQCGLPVLNQSQQGCLTAVPRSKSRLKYKLKRCLNKECCKQCRYVMFKGTMTKWPVQKLTQGTTQKLLQHHDATDI